MRSTRPGSPRRGGGDGPARVRRRPARRGRGTRRSRWRCSIAGVIRGAGFGAPRSDRRSGDGPPGRASRLQGLDLGVGRVRDPAWGCPPDGASMPPMSSMRRNGTRRGRLVLVGQALDEVRPTEWIDLCWRPRSSAEDLLLAEGEEAPLLRGRAHASSYASVRSDASHPHRGQGPDGDPGQAVQGRWAVRETLRSGCWNRSRSTARSPPRSDACRAGTTSGARPGLGDLLEEARRGWEKNDRRRAKSSKRTPARASSRG